MKIKVSETTSTQLDWLVAKCEGRKIRFNLGGGLEVRGRSEDGKDLPDEWDLWMTWHPTANWAQGGPIIESEKINTGWNDARLPIAWLGSVSDYDTVAMHCGLTPLIAAMRCFVASLLGDEVEIPEELT